MKEIIVLVLGLISTLSALIVKQELERVFYKGKVSILFHSLNIYFVTMLLSILILIVYNLYHNISSVSGYLLEILKIGVFYVPCYILCAFFFKKYMLSMKKYEVRGNLLVIKPKYLSRKH
ncbi:hypothetical protein [Metabacillus sp. RGM 3146]|uniref:hypothetical protein n=1 Tax=Metabacillus sp. RGM 3146 TaxID=3401092 RepID=UPI003B9BF3D5